MKYIYTLLSILTTSHLMAQIVIHDDAGNTVVSPTLTVDSLSTVDHSDAIYYLVNTGGTDVSVYWTRTRNADHASITLDQICDDVICFDATDTDYYTRPASFTIASGDSSIFWPKVFPGDVPACAIYTYKVFVGLGTLQDSIRITWSFDSQSCFLGAEEEAAAVFAAYPNPASNLFNIKLASNTANVAVRIFNILGEEVLEQNLILGLNTIDLDEFTSGVYFYSILQNNKAIETKKLIVRK
jgi:hypothetical protein